MKALPLLVLAATLCSCGYQRIGSMTMISTRNVDRSAEYQPLMRGVEAKAKMKHDDALQEAVDQAVAQAPGGEYLMNAAIYVKMNGRKVKVRGDVWGHPRKEGVAAPVQTGHGELKVGDRVAITPSTGGKVTNGVIVGLRNTTAMVEYDTKALNGTTKKVMREVPFERLTRLQ